MESLGDLEQKAVNSGPRERHSAVTVLWQEMKSEGSEWKATDSANTRNSESKQETTMARQLEPATDSHIWMRAMAKTRSATTGCSWYQCTNKLYSQRCSIIQC